MIAIIGGETRRFRPLIDLYRETGKRFGHSPNRLKVGVHALGYIARTTREAIDDFFPGYARAIASVAKERRWPAVTRADFDAQRTPEGALLVGNAEEVVGKIVRHSEALGGISRLTFQMNAASLPHTKLMQAIEAIGTRVVPALRERFADESNLDETAVSWVDCSAANSPVLTGFARHFGLLCLPHSGRCGLSRCEW